MSTNTSLSTEEWANALKQAETENDNTKLPLEGVLLTLRLDKEGAQTRVSDLLSQLEQDKLCKYCLVLALDSDEADSDSAKELVSYIENNHKATKVITLTNNTANNNSFPICQVWNNMANAAFEEGADWVLLLGDDVNIKCASHYTKIFKAFLDISKQTSTPFGFGAPFLNDESLPGVPTFPVVGRVHYDIFKGLIPKWRAQDFIRQDLDLYLNRLYLKFDAAPCIANAKLTNEYDSSNTTKESRFDSQAPTDWKYWVADDTKFMSKYLSSLKDLGKFTERTMVDIITPTYRIDIPIITGICELEVPESWHYNYIIVVDNPKKLCQMMEESDSDKAALKLEQIFKDSVKDKEGKRVGNNVKVICNRQNKGASATRNRALDTTTADFILFLDDDVEPNPDMLFAYDEELSKMEDNCVGLVGLVKFPRRKNMPLIHAAVLMSYLVYTFEIADKPQLSKANWGVTANLLVRHSKIRFDGVHFSIGGGEDVDFCLRTVGMDKMATRKLSDDSKYFKSVPKAAITHDFWKGGIPCISHHVYYFGYGDSGLFNRYQDCCFWSYLNIVEFFALIFIPFCPVILNNGWRSIFTILAEMVALFCVDVGFEMFNPQLFKERINYFDDKNVYSLPYYIGAHILANYYVICFQIGRLYGHWMRGKLLQNAGRRFDSQCGNLPDAGEACVNLERRKLIGFAIATLLVIRCV